MAKKMICNACESEEVFRDAYASWDVEAQTWILSNVYDQAYCNSCEGECSIREVEI